MNATRIEYMDGLRGVAIITVLLFHTFARWNDLLPYAKFSELIPALEYGFVGVQLFFMLSGYVILMTLEKTDSLAMFAWKRWLRLFPAMLIGSIIIYLTSGLLPHRPVGSITLKNLLPGLTFMEPQIWGHLIGFPQKSIEGAFWTLYVEVKFYFFAAIAYYFGNKQFMLRLLILLFSSSAIIMVLGSKSNAFISPSVLKFLHYTSFIHFGWFASGCSFYLHHTTKNQRHLWAACLLALLSCPFTTHHPDPKIWPNAIAALFAACLFCVALYSKHIQSALSTRFLLFFGAISYPLYLIHENALVSSIKQLAIRYGDGPQAYLYPIPIIFALCTFAYLISNFGEPYIRSLLIWKPKVNPN